MAAPNVGQMLAEAWAAAVKRGDLDRTTRTIEWPARPYVPDTPTAEERAAWAAADADWKAEERAAWAAADADWKAEWAAKQAAESAAFLGTIVKAEKDGNGDLLTFADGRQLLIISDEYEWKKP